MTVGTVIGQRKNVLERVTETDAMDENGVDEER